MGAHAPGLEGYEKPLVAEHERSRCITRRPQWRL